MPHPTCRTRIACLFDCAFIPRLVRLRSPSFLARAITAGSRPSCDTSMHGRRREPSKPSMRSASRGRRRHPCPPLLLPAPRPPYSAVARSTRGTQSASLSRSAGATPSRSPAATSASRRSALSFSAQGAACCTTRPTSCRSCCRGRRPRCRRRLRNCCPRALSVRRALPPWLWPEAAEVALLLRQKTPLFSSLLFWGLSHMTQSPLSRYHLCRIRRGSSAAPSVPAAAGWPLAQYMRQHQRRQDARTRVLVQRRPPLCPSLHTAQADRCLPRLSHLQRRRPSCA